MGFRIINENIINVVSDAIVIPANPKAVVGNGVDKLIYDAAGKDEILLERKKIGDIEVGNIAFTSAGKLDYKIIIHAVSPTWDGGNSGEEELLKNCYTKSLECALDNGCKSIVFPLLSTGVLKFPKKLAKSIAESAIYSFLEKNDMDVTLVLYKRSSVSQKILDGIDDYLIENDYSHLDVAYYKKCEKEWSSLPEDREEHSILELMRKQYARKLEDEKKYERYLSKYSNPEPIIHNYGYHFMTIYDRASILSDYKKYKNEHKRPEFRNVLKSILEENGITYNTDSEIINMTGIDQSTFSRLQNGREVSVYKARDIVWILGIRFKFKLSQIEDLLCSIGLTDRGGLKGKQEDIDRDNLIGYIFKCGITDMEDINGILKQKGYKELCRE